MPLFRDFTGLNLDTRLPDETTILRFSQLLEEHKLSAQIPAVDNESLGAKGLMLRTGKRPDAKDGARWIIAMRPGMCRQLEKAKLGDQLTEQLERIKANI